MAQSFIDKYVFALMLDSSNFEKGANLATKAANGIKDTILKTYSIVGGIDLFKNMVLDYTNTARSLDNLNLATGESITTLQAWEKSIQDVGGNVGAFQGTLKGLSQSFANLRQFGRVDERLGLLGWQGIDLYRNGKMKQATDVMLEIARKIKSMNESDSWSWAQALGIDESTYRLFRLHGDNLDQIIKKNEKWAVLKKNDIKTMREYDVMISDFKNSWLAFSREITSSVLPIIQNELFPAFKNITKYLISNKDSITEVGRSFTVLAVDAIKAINSIMGEIGKRTGEIQGYIMHGHYEEAGQSLFDLTPLGMGMNWLKDKSAKWAQSKMQHQAELKNNLLYIQSMNVTSNDPEAFSNYLNNLAETGNPNISRNKLDLGLAPQIIGVNNL